MPNNCDTNWKGIILAGGTGSRLHPLTLGVSKHLLAVYDKPMIYYPLAVLMLAKIREVLVITTPEDQENYQRLLGDGTQFGINIQYQIQAKPAGIAQAFIIAESFIGTSNICLVLGDNIFYGQGFTPKLHAAKQRDSGATIFAHHVNQANRFGVVEFDAQGKACSIEEKPTLPKSNYAVTGLYFYDASVVNVAKQLKPSARNELEITDINLHYLAQNNMHVEVLARGFTWLDTGTHDALIHAGHFVQTIEQQQGLKVACLEEIALDNGWLNKAQVLKRGEEISTTQYGQYLIGLCKNESH